MATLSEIHWVRITACAFFKEFLGSDSCGQLVWELLEQGNGAVFLAARLLSPL